MTWMIAMVILFILLIVMEEVIYFYLRTKVIENPKKEINEGKMKSLYYKVKLKLNHPQ